MMPVAEIERLIHQIKQEIAWAKLQKDWLRLAVESEKLGVLEYVLNFED